MGGNRPGAQVVAIGKTAGDDDQIDIGQVGIAVPVHDGIAAGTLPQRHLHIAVAVGAGGDDDGSLHPSRSIS